MNTSPWILLGLAIAAQAIAQPNLIDTNSPLDREGKKKEHSHHLTRSPDERVDFGPNVLVFDSTMEAASIQNRLDQIFLQQEKSEFGSGRYAILFKPGKYQANVRVGFYTQILGLGHLPDDVTITGHVSADAKWAKGNATVNFWRGVENISVVPAGGIERWAVSQASPLRRVHIKGNVALDDGGWSSGGFIADSIVDGEIRSGNQQQWITRNSEIGRWQSSNWNMVFVGVDGAPAESFPKPPYVVVDRAPVTAEKPFLQLSSDGSYGVTVPSISTNSQGPTWAKGPATAVTIPLSEFYIAKEGADTAITLNAALSRGENLLLTPGTYHLTDTLKVARPNTIVLGIGLATVVAENGVTAMSVADVSGVKIAGILFSAGATNSKTLLEVGPKGSALNHSQNPTCLYDLFFRVGGAAIGKTDACIIINSHQVIGDDFWIWRADHGDGVGWNENTTTNGLIVNGTDVVIYGLAVEHFHQYQTLWNGNGGRVYFYQSEEPYDVPLQADWTHDNENGFASYKVADSVITHEAWGLGVYCFFHRNKQIKLQNAMEAPHVPGVKFHDLTTVSLGGGTGEITHLVNNTGTAAAPAQIMATLKEYP